MIILVDGKGKKRSSSSVTSEQLVISTRVIQGIVEKLKSQQHRDSTRKNCYAIWKIFNKFFLHLDHKPLDWDNRITLFVGYMIDKGRKSSTIRSYLSAIRSVLKIEGIEIHEDQYLLTALIKACKLKTMSSLWDYLSGAACSRFYYVVYKNYFRPSHTWKYSTQPSS